MKMGARQFTSERKKTANKERKRPFELARILRKVKGFVTLFGAASEQERKVTNQMSTTLDGDDTISADEVRSRIAEIESQIIDLEVIVTRDSDGEELGRFADVEDAEAFIQSEDYDPDKVTVSEEEEDEDLRDELNELNEFASDCRSTFGSFEWSEGITLRNGDTVDERFAKDYFNSAFGRIEEEIEYYVDWSGYADSLTEGREYAELNGNYYYDL